MPETGFGELSSGLAASSKLRAHFPRFKLLSSTTRSPNSQLCGLGGVSGLTDHGHASPEDKRSWGLGWPGSEFSEGKGDLSGQRTFGWSKMHTQNGTLVNGTKEVFKF